MCVHRHTFTHIDMNMYYKYVVKKLKLDKRVKNKRSTSPPIDDTTVFHVSFQKSFNVQTCINI